jgi:hypothetical protein
MKKSSSQGGTWRRRIQRSLAWLLLPALLAGGVAYWKAEFIVLGAEGYVFGYPLVIMDVTRQNAALTLGPPNVLRRVRQFPDAHFKDVVRPNVDTLYSTAFIDLTPGPLVWEMQANDLRYEVMPFMDAWTNVFASPGTRTTGTQGGRYLIAGPTWQGTTPANMTLLRAPTHMVWLIGRTQTQGIADYPLVHRLQDGLQLSPLHPRSDAAVAPLANAQTPQAQHLAPIVQMQRMATRDFYDRLTHLMVANPPAAADAPMLRKLERIGVTPGHAVSWSRLDSMAVSLGRWIADFKIAQELKKPRDLVNGWSTPPRILGQYGTAYNIRAVVAMIGLGANLPEDAMYPSTQVDSTGATLNGSHDYRLHFAADQMPPVKAFWSVTAYGQDDFLIDNSAQRYAVGSLSSMARNADGSMDILIQPQPPEGAMRNNWLPVQAGSPFLLNARLYWPKSETLEGRWHLPAIERVR